MEFGDFLTEFNTIYTSRLFGNRDWHRRAVRGEWRGETAGGR